MRIRKDLWYATKIWLLSTFVPPVLFCFFALVTRGIEGVEVALFLAWLSVIYGLFLSLPSLLILTLIVSFIGRKNGLDTKAKKVIMQIVFIVLCLLLLIFLFFNPIKTHELIWGIPYAAILSFGVWYFDWSSEEAEPLTIIEHLVD